MAQAASAEYVIAFEKLRNSDVGKVGGKNASLGEMISQLADTGVRVPGERRIRQVFGGSRGTHRH